MTLRTRTGSRSRPRVLSRALAPALAVALLSLSACGGGSDDGDDGADGGSDSSFTDQDGTQIADAAKEAMAGLESVRFAGDISSDGQDISIEIQLNTAGDCTGTLGTGGGTAEIISVDGSTWFRPDDAFWEMTAGSQAEQIIALVDGRYVALEEGDDQFAQFCDLDELLDQLLDTSGEDATFTKGEVSELDGEDVIAIEREDPEDGTSTGFVQVDGDNYLVKIERTGDDSGEVTFDAFNEDFDVEAPAEDEQVSAAELGG